MDQNWKQTNFSTSKSLKYNKTANNTKQKHVIKNYTLS